MVWTGFFVFTSVVLFCAWIETRREASAGKLDSVIREYEVVREEFLAPKKKGPNFLVRLSRKVMGVEARETLREKLAHAGLSERYTPEEFYALKIACAAISFSVLSPSQSGPAPGRFLRDFALALWATCCRTCGSTTRGSAAGLRSRKPC